MFGVEDEIGDELQKLSDKVALIQALRNECEAANTFRDAVKYHRHCLELYGAEVIITGKAWLDVRRNLELYEHARNYRLEMESALGK